MTAAERWNERLRFVDSSTLRGTAFCRGLAIVTDDWVEAIYDHALRESGLDAEGLALVAVGGYGRGMLAPGSDLDVLLLHGKRKQVDALTALLWYPMWDVGVKLGHGVFTSKEAARLASGDLEVATAQLGARRLAGDQALVDEVLNEARTNWRKRSSAWLAELRTRVADRRTASGDVAFLLEPDLKEGHGGLRDIQALQWAEAAGLELDAIDRSALADAEEVLMTARVALHRVTGKASDVLRLEDQDAVAPIAGFDDADALMAAVSTAGRSVAWVADEAWSRTIAKRPADRVIAPGVDLRNGVIELTDRTDPSADPGVVFRLAAASARQGAPISRRSLRLLAAELPSFTQPWPAEAKGELVALLLEGHSAIPAIEAIDQMGVLAKVLPEWEAVRNKPQRNAYHTYTVDRHLLEATANAARIADRVSRPDLLVIGTLLHDLGKGRTGDHTDNGVEIARSLGPRLGFGAADTDVLVELVRLHLLLPDVATRRDLADDSTISAVAEAVRTPLVLELLHALTEADSLATGPSAWGSWKAQLVAELTDRVAHVLGGGDVNDLDWHVFPGAHVLALMARGGVHVLPEGDLLTTVAPDRLGVLSRVAGVLSLHGLGVLAAEAHSDEHGMASNEFRVQVPKHGVDWKKVSADLERALEGQLAIEARLADRARSSRRRKRTSAEALVPSVRIDNDASSNATVVEVRAPDRLGVLYRITKALAELALDIRHAKVQTMGDEVVDSFYVRGADGKVTDTFHLREIERAVLHAVS